MAIGKLAGITAAFLLIAACGTETSTPSAEPPRSEYSEPSDETIAPNGPSPWQWHRVQALEVECYSSFADLVNAADVVALGTVMDATASRVWESVEEDGDTDVTVAIAYTVQLDDILFGDPVGPEAGVIEIEFIPMSAPPIENGVEALISEAAKRMVGESSLFILRRKGAPIPAIGRTEGDPEELSRRIYRVVCSPGLIDDVGGAARLPLVTESGVKWVDELESLTYAQAVARAQEVLR